MTFREFLYREEKRFFVEEEYISIIDGFLDEYSISYDKMLIEMPDERWGYIYTIYSSGNIEACSKLLEDKISGLRSITKRWYEVVRHD